MRKNSRTVVKNYDTDTFNEWALAYEYESQNKEKPASIQATGTKGTGAIYVSKLGDNLSINVGGGAELDMALIENIKSEIEAIEASFSKTK